MGQRCMGVDGREGGEDKCGGDSSFSQHSHIRGIPDTSLNFSLWIIYRSIIFTKV